MTIHFACPGCKKVMTAPDDKAGVKVQCRSCGQRLQIPLQPNKVPAGPVPARLPTRSRPADVAQPKRSETASARSVSTSETFDFHDPATPPMRGVRRAWPAYLFGLPAFLLGVAALPAAVTLASTWLGVLLAGLGVFLAVLAFVFALVNRGRGLGVSSMSVLACGAALFGAIMLAGGAGGLLKSLPGSIAGAGTNQDGNGEPTAGPKEGTPATAATGEGAQPPQPTDPGKPPGPAHIRLSGIHLNESGSLSIQDRSDIDLWKDNPVEADAKWQGKTVDVEMEMFDLGILRLGDDAALATLADEGHPIYAMRGGWQNARFIFRGDHKKQLIGLQNREGTVVIRGKCEGLNGGRVTFDDCMIADMPIANRPDAGPANVPANAAVAPLVAKLGNKDPTVRIKAANELAQLGAAARPAARALCSAAIDDSQEVRQAALEALEKVQPALAKPITTLVVRDVFAGNSANQIENMGEAASPAIPVLIWHAKQMPRAPIEGGNSVWDIQALAKVGPTDPEAVRAILEYAQSSITRTNGVRPKDPGDKPTDKDAPDADMMAATPHEVAAALTALGKMSQNKGDLRQEIVACLVKVLAQEADSPSRIRLSGADLSANDSLFAAINSLVQYGADAKAAIPALKRLKLDKEMAVRDQAGAALEKIDK